MHAGHGPWLPGDKKSQIEKRMPALPEAGEAIGTASTLREVRQKFDLPRVKSSG